MNKSEKELLEKFLAKNLNAISKKGIPQRKEYNGVSLVVGGTSSGWYEVLLDKKEFKPMNSYLLEIKNPELKEGGFDILVDAGLGSFINYKNLGISVNNIKVILISHDHVDHTADLPAFLLTQNCKFKKDIILVTNPTLAKRMEAKHSIWSNYFRNMLADIKVLNQNGKIKILNVEIEATPSFHVEAQGVNRTVNSYKLSVLLNDVVKIGFLMDTPIIEFTNARRVIHSDVLEPFIDVDTLIIYAGSISLGPSIKYHSRIFDNNICLHGIFETIDFFVKYKAMPKRILLTHFGGEMYISNVEELKGLLKKNKSKNLIELMLKEVRKYLLQKGQNQVKVNVLKEGLKLDLA